jgi:hypothetical protein
MPLLGVGWLLWSLWTFGAAVDVYVLLPFVAFHGGRLLRGPLERAARLPQPLGALAGGLLLLALAWVALQPSADFLHPGSREMRADRLARQQSLVGTVASLSGPDGRFAAISAEEYYVLREVPSPLPFLRLSMPCIPFLPLYGYAHCEAALGAILALAPEAIVVQTFDRASACERRAERWFRQRGYVRKRAERRAVILARTHLTNPDRARRSNSARDQGAESQP